MQCRVWTATLSCFLLSQVLRCSTEPRALLEELEQGLTREVCERIDALQICSERASALEFALDESTLDSFRALWDAGFMCYDMAFVGTKDRQLIAASPMRFRWRIEELEPAEIPFPSTQYTIRQLRESGASIYEMPTLDQFLRDLRRRMMAANLHEVTFQDSDLRRPWVFVRLLEPEYTPDLLRQVAATANRHRALPFLVLVFDSAQAMEAVQEMGLWRGKMMLSLTTSSSIEEVRASPQEGKLGQLSMVGSEASLQDEALKQLRETNKLLFAHSVEEEQLLLRALQQGFAGISTTSPVRMQQALHEWRAECQAKDVNPATQPDTI